MRVLVKGLAIDKRAMIRTSGLFLGEAAGVGVPSRKGLKAHGFDLAARRAGQLKICYLQVAIVQPFAAGDQSFIATGLLR
jgi:hypothetical protein